MKTLPESVSPYRKTPVYTAETVPAGLLRQHRTKPGVWGLIHVTRGSLRYCIAETGEDVELTEATPGVIEPECTHSVAPQGDVAFYVEFWR